MSFCSPVYANEICAVEGAGFGSVFNREDDITVIGQSRWVDPTISFDDIASSSHSVIALDVRNKLMEVHLISAGRRHECRSMRNLLDIHVSGGNG